MENDPKPTEKLDWILNFFKTQKSYLTDDQLNVNLKSVGFAIEPDDLIRVLDTLINDGYIIEKKTDVSQNLIASRYLISYKGYLFIDSGGYVAKASRDAADALHIHLDNQRQIALQDHSEKNSKHLNLLTLWLAVGTIILALIEIIKFLCDTDPTIKSFFEKIL